LEDRFVFAAQHCLRLPGSGQRFHPLPAQHGGFRFTQRPSGFSSRDRSPRLAVADRPTDAASHAANDEQNRQAQHERHRQGALIPPREFAKPIPCGRRARLHRLVGQVALHIHRQAVGRMIYYCDGSWH
jgi:hypothetical protein